MKRLSYISALFLVFASLSFTSCTKDDPNDDDPTADDRDKFVGTWKCQENSTQTGTNPVFNVTIAKSTTDNTQISISNFYNFGGTIKSMATISTSSVTIPTQNISGNTVKGSGSMQGTATISLNYTVFDGSATDTVAATLTKM